MQTPRNGTNRLATRWQVFFSSSHQRVKPILLTHITLKELHKVNKISAVSSMTICTEISMVTQWYLKCAVAIVENKTFISNGTKIRLMSWEIYKNYIFPKMFLLTFYLNYRRPQYLRGIDVHYLWCFWMLYSYRSCVQVISLGTALSINTLLQCAARHCTINLFTTRIPPWAMKFNIPHPLTATFIWQDPGHL